MIGVKNNANVVMNFGSIKRQYGTAFDGINVHGGLPLSMNAFSKPNGFISQLLQAVIFYSWGIMNGFRKKLMLVSWDLALGPH